MSQKHLVFLFLANTVLAAAVGASTFALLSRAPTAVETSSETRTAASTKEAAPPAIVEAEPDSAPCTDDLKKFCKATDLRSQGPMGCLGGHMADLSPACASVVKESQKGLASKCGAEITKYCQNVPMAEGRVLRCLRENIVKLGNACKKKIDQI